MNRPRFTIRTYEPADRPAVQAVCEAGFAPVYASFRKIVGPEIAEFSFRNAEPQQGEHVDQMCQPNSGFMVRVALVEEQVVGFCSYSIDPDKRVGEIGQNAVHPDFGGLGIGTALYRDAMAAMRHIGMRVAIVSTGGDPSHAPARAAYHKAGFDAEIPLVQLSCAL